jgi:hypothetical protein
LLGPVQSQVKVLGDSISNHAQLSTLPSFSAKGRRTTAKLKLGPLSVENLTSNGEIKRLDLGDYPIAAANQQGELFRQAAEYAGRFAAGVDPRLSELHNEFDIVMWQSQLREIYMMLLGYYQTYLTDEELGRIVGSDGKELAAARQDIQGRFDLDVVFDPRNLDLEYLERKAKVFNEFLKPLDMKAQLKWDVIAASMFQAFDPNLAERAIEPVQAASRREVEEEETNFVKIAAGIEPEMAEAGQDFALREQVLRNIVERNPEALESMNDTSKKILESRVQHLMHMVQQQENAQTGRVGAQAALA